MVFAVGCGRQEPVAGKGNAGDVASSPLSAPVDYLAANAAGKKAAERTASLAPGQGALGIECRADRADLLALFGVLNHEATAACVRAERALSRALSGSCQLPLGAYAQNEGSLLRLRAFVAQRDGQKIVSDELSGDAGDPEALGAEMARRLLAQGAAEILAAIAP